ncbi:MAG: hypothetical protein AAF340_15095 [Pseudomonadota bacterium]
MPSTSIADYQVIRDGTFTLQDSTNDVETFTFAVPDDLNRSTSGARKSVLTFNMRPEQDSRVTVRMHTTNIMTNRSFSQSHTRMHQETFDIDAILSTGGGVPSEGARVQFIAVGKVTFSDVVIWYQINR